MYELLAGAVVAIAVLALILEPLFRRYPAMLPLGLDDEAGGDDFTPLDESESPKIQALLALKEIEFDRATGKLSDEDYALLKTQYAARALDAINAEEAAAASTAVEVLDDPAEALIQQVRARARACPACGPRPEAEAHFCSNCGRPIE